MVNLRLLDWDSRVLNKKCAFLEIKDSYSKELCVSISSLLKKAKKDNVDFITTKVGCNNVALVNMLENEGFKLINGEYLLGRGNKLERIDKNKDCLDVRFYSKKMISGLERLSSVFTLDRFSRDSRINKSQRHKIWSTSIKDQCEGYASWFAVGYINKKPSGIITAFDENKTTKFFLVAMDHESQGKGLGTVFLKKAINNALKSSDIIYTETQIDNLKALALYEKTGFKKISCRYILHKWLND